MSTKSVQKTLDYQRITIEDNLEYFREIKIELNDHINTVMDEVNILQNNFKREDQDHQEFLSRK